MTRLLKTIGVMVAAAVVVCNTGCFKSDNEGLLEGTKWASAYVPEFKNLRGATAKVQFNDGGRFAMEFRVPHGVVRCSGTWRLGPGSVVYLENVAPALGGQSEFLEHIVVAGDVMTMEDPDGTKIVFTRIDEEMERAAKSSAPPSDPAKPPLPEGTDETTEKNGRSVKRNYD